MQKLVAYTSAGITIPCSLKRISLCELDVDGISERYISCFRIFS